MIDKKEIEERLDEMEKDIKGSISKLFISDAFAFNHLRYPENAKRFVKKYITPLTLTNNTQESREYIYKAFLEYYIRIANYYRQMEINKDWEGRICATAFSEEDL